MKKSKSTTMVIVVAAIALCWNMSAWAGPYNSFVDQRRMAQEQRIQEAWQAGLLSPGVYQSLENQQQRILVIENQMRADGRLDPWEKSRLGEMLDHSDWEIDRHIHRRWRPDYYRGWCGGGW